MKRGDHIRSPTRSPLLFPRPKNHLLTCNSSTRIRRSDLFMLMALWMEKKPHDPSKRKPYSSPAPDMNVVDSSSIAVSATSPPVQSSSPMHSYLHGGASPSVALPTGAVLVDPRDRVLALDRTGEAHAAVRCILSATSEVFGSDMYLSRYPCALCMKVMVQAGVRKIFYFPAEKWELASPTPTPFDAERLNKNKRAVSRLVSNNPIAMTFFIPQWDHGELAEDLSEFCLDHDALEVELVPEEPLSALLPWQLDDSIGTAPGIIRRWETVKSKFERTCKAVQLLQDRYNVDVKVFRGDHREEAEYEIKDTSARLPFFAHHAIVLANIAARRTDDPKLGVGTVIVEEDAADGGKYVSVGWNGYPKKSLHLDYPQAGADDSVEDEELKYDYILHSEQNALLWRNPSGSKFSKGWLICTKMPCDECSPMIYDCGIQNVVTVPQPPKHPDDPSRFRGLTYERVQRLMDSLHLFQI